MRVNSEDGDRWGRGWVYWLRGQVTITVFYAVTGDKAGACGVIWFLTINPEAVFHISHNKTPQKVLTLCGCCASPKMFLIHCMITKKSYSSIKI